MHTLLSLPSLVWCPPIVPVLAPTPIWNLGASTQLPVCRRCVGSWPLVALWKVCRLAAPLIHPVELSLDGICRGAAHPGE